MCTNANDELDKMTQELNKNIEKMIEIGRLKAETVWDVIKQLEKPLFTTAKTLSAMLITQVSVERLFSSMKFILSKSYWRPYCICVLMLNEKQTLDVRAAAALSDTANFCRQMVK